MMKVPVSVVVIARNEERNIEKCLRSASQCDEVFVVDSASEDATVAIADSLGAHVVQFLWDGREPKKKQWSLENLPFSNDWVLFLDADEEMSPELVEEIAELVSQDSDVAGYFARYDYVFGQRTLRRGHRVHKLILHNRHRSYFPQYPDLGWAHASEHELHVQPRIEGRVGLLRGRVRHDDRDDLFHYFDRHNRYSDWESRLRAGGVLPDPAEAQPRWRKALKRAFSVLPFKGTIAFFDSLVLKGGFLDGRAGFDYAVARGVYYWQIGLKMRELRAAGAGESSQPGSGEGTT
jgi:glycosyltransferase involved in cell wall biosynthesis